MALRAPRPQDPIVACGLADPDDPVVSALERVLDRVGRGGLLRRLAAPLPPSDPFPEGRLSPRLVTLLAKGLDGGGADRVLLVGDPLVTVAATLLELDEPAEEVVLASHAPSRARWTADRVGLKGPDAGLTIVDLEDELPRGPFARILCYGAADRAALLRRLDPDGVLLEAQVKAGQAALTKHIRVAGEGVDLDLSRHWFGPTDGPRARGRPARTPIGASAGRLLLVEHMQDNAWRGLAASPTEHGVLRAVRDTFLGGSDAPGLDEEEPVGSDDPDLRLARRLFHLAYLEQVAGTRHTAAALYRSSLSVHETPEAWTFYGWVRSQDGSLQEAVDACRRAIGLDPGFGNPYNDIGAYLMAEGRPGVAKNWFERATRAPRYAAPHYPYTNLGRVYLREGDLLAARQAVENALEMMPGYPPAERLLREIETREAHDPGMR